MDFSNVESYRNTNPVAISDDDFKAAAKRLGLSSTAPIRAVAQVEAGGRRGFWADGLPVILYEPHIFGRETRHAFHGKTYSGNSKYPLSTKNRKLNNYAPVRPTDLRFKILTEMVKLDETAALKSVSWGMFQIMGFNYRAVGYGSPQEMVRDFIVGGEAAQLRAFVSFIFANNIDDELRALNWAAFAAVYNGSSYADNAYDVKMQTAYNKFFKTYGNDVGLGQASNVPSDTSIERSLLGRKGPAIKKLQEWLNKNINAGLVADGVYGNRTMMALRACNWTQDVMRETLTKTFKIAI